jgi:hypothetical protein
MACMMACRIGGILLTPAVIVALAGCAVSHSESADAAASARSLFRAVDRHEGRAAFAVLAPAAAESLTTGGVACGEEIMKLGLRGGPISHVQVWGDRAQARAGSDIVFLSRFGGHGWKVTAAGCRPRRDRPYDCEIEG